MYKRQGVRFAVAAAPTAVVRADPRRLRQVVDGLAENALRVTPRGAPLVVATGGVATTSWLQVRDGGPGFAPEGGACFTVTFPVADRTVRR